MVGRYSIIIAFLFSFQLFGSNGLKVLNSTESSITFEYTPSYDISDHEVDGNIFKRISFRGGAIDFDLEPGQPEVPIFGLTIGVPGEFGNRIQLISSEKRIVNGELIPISYYKSIDEMPEPVYEKSEKYGSVKNFRIVDFGENGYIGQLAVQKLKIFPVQFDADKNEITLFDKIIFTVIYSRVETGLQKIDNELLEMVIANYDVARNWGKVRQTARKISSSVLSSGTWYKFETPDEGIYKIDRSMLPSMGIDPATVDPRTIKIYNNGGKNLPENINASRPGDLLENAIRIVGESDGKFDEGDYILFYGRGVDFFEYDSSSTKFVRRKNWYSKKNYYWITSGGSNGKRMDAIASLSGTSAYSQTTTKAFQFTEDDRYKILPSGRLYFGDEYSTSANSKTYATSLTNIIPNSRIRYYFQFVNASSPSLQLEIFENGDRRFSRSISGYGANPYSAGDLYSSFFEYTGTLPDDRSMLKFSFNATASNHKGYLDYFEIEYERLIKAINDELIFYSKDTTADIRYSVNNFVDSFIEVYNVSDFYDVKIVQPASISGGQFTFISAEQEGNVSKYYSLNKSKYKTPVNFEKVENSNYRGDDPGAELIVITSRQFEEQAQRFAEYRSTSTSNAVEAKVFYVEQIYNEFGSGIADPTAIRDFVKYAYDNWSVQPQYVLLFGDGNYDYYNIEGADQNFITTYQSIESLREIYSYPSDDYYGWISGNDSLIDIAIGRIPVKSNSDAKIIVDKVIRYETELPKSLWRTKITLVADDGLTSDGDDGKEHTFRSEQLTGNIPKYFDLNKIYLIRYPTVITGLGRRKPNVNDAIIDAINNGTLILNFQGHGNPSVWTHERVYEKSVTIPRLKNSQYFFLAAATCDFARYDDPQNTSGTEEMLFLPDAGTIGAFASARAVYSGQNSRLNEYFFSYLLENRSDLNKPNRIGLAYQSAKVAYAGTNTEKFHLICDPTLRLNEPSMPVNIDSVNGQNLSTQVQIKALGEVNVAGTVLKNDGTLNSTFNGEVILTVFDSEQIFRVNDWNYDIHDQGGVIFKGRASVSNGEFTSSFIVPKDISYENKNGKIVAYIYDDESDGIGSTESIIVGGTDSTAVDDGEGPSIDIYFDNFDFENAYLLNPEFTLLAKLEDQSGLNTTGTGIGHRLEGILNKDEDKPIDFTEYFIGDLDAGGKSGVVDYLFTNMNPGDYSIQIRAYDVFNNFSEEETHFTVVEGDGLVIRNIVNFPNPFSGSTFFTFQQNLSNPINVKIKIYTVAGRMIKEIEQYGLIEKFVRIPWDGRDADGNQLANGTYLYKLVVETVDGQYSENFLGKLAVIR
ncbi:MAG: type IX secretion system sortase PorU [Melioribacteraceae bacterium]|nr:type IX secretion system sortase PorU [Melioribacteraceae bacterium]MCF8355258.1 type IX secretion system sortase PorU [Melioribacteraceae bacterium]MCF8394157.1 type IX secretion system sortase PorU [Melioribacteraceae bacterium]MCF8418840.1 type IX secretion system sortase PorU [Melioribacteraceae bacterium]